MAVTFAPVALASANNGMLTIIDGGTSAAYIAIYNADNILLAVVPLNSPGGTLDPLGVLTLSIAGPDPSANATGTASYAVLQNDLTPVAVFDVKEGDAPENGYLVMQSTSIAIGEPVTILSVTFGA